MSDLLKLMLAFLASLFKSRAQLEAEFLVLRQQVNVLRRRMPKRPVLTSIDRLVFVWLYRWFPSTVGAFAIVRPETVIRWHRRGLPRLLALAVRHSCRQAEGIGRVARPHPRDEPGEPALGCTAHPR